MEYPDLPDVVVTGSLAGMPRAVIDVDPGNLPSWLTRRDHVTADWPRMQATFDSNRSNLQAENDDEAA